MNKAKDLKIMIAIAVILATIVSYLGWKNDAVAKQLQSAHHNIQLKIEKYNALQNEFEVMQHRLQLESDKVLELNIIIDGMKEELATITDELNIVNMTITDVKSEEYELLYIGDFKLTHYCNEFYEHICGYGDGLTATGTNVTPGRTIAVDPTVIPYGTEVYIEGYGWRTAEDCGGSVKGNHIDIAVYKRLRRHR